MCDSCTSAQSGFTQGATPKDRTLQTSVEQGTSPDWSSSGDYNDEGRGPDGYNDDLTGM